MTPGFVEGNNYMYYSAIKETDIANGPGIRVSLFVSGCRNHCEGCFQPETWNFLNGEPFIGETEQKLIGLLSRPYIQGFTLLGGDPFEEENQKSLLPFLQKVKARCPDKDIWAYTGYLLDKDLQKGGKKHTKYTKEFLKNIDVLVDGPFIIEEKPSTPIAYKGSLNQRIIDLNKTRELGKICLYIL